MAVLSRNIECWRKINAPPKILRYIQEGVYIPFHSIPPVSEVENHNLHHEEKLFVNSKLNEYLEKGYISQVSVKPICISAIGCAKKKGPEKFRLINDMRVVNQYINVPKVRYEDLSLLPDTVKRHDLYASIDLKDGFNQIPIKPEFRKYFGFKWNSVFYQWNVLNFGCSISPYLFTKILRPVVQYLRESGVRCLLYVDDFLICGSKTLVKENVQFSVDTLEDLGFKVNFQKSNLDPANSIEYLGLLIENDIEGVPILKVPKSKIQKIRKDINRLLKSEYISARVLAKVCGQCNFVCRATLPGRLMLRNVYRLLKSKNTWESRLILDEGSIKDLSWWRDSLEKWNGRTILPTNIDGQLTTDASHIGWGAHYRELETQGYWDERMSLQHSNVRELTAVLLAIRAFKHAIQNKNIQVLSDNITTVAYINHMGGPIKQLTNIAKDIWKEAIHSNITITARYLAGKENIQADRLSRQLDKHEWMISRPLFRYLDSMWGPHTVDRFASAISTQLPVYNSRYLDPNGMKVDALAQPDWQQENNYVNPPIRLMSQILRIIQNQKAHATIIAPYWPTQVWFPLLRRLSISPPLRIFKRCIIQLNEATPEPLRNRRWKLFAWRICGNNTHFKEDGHIWRHRE